ncbi:MAG TPA: alpha/beta hydrolase [Streptosporangiaceae bacterium]
MERSVLTPDGRTLTIEDAGDPGGKPVLVHNGTPGSRQLYGPHQQDAAERGLRLISYDRPGYGGSTPDPGRTVADCAGDVRAICDGLGIDRLAIWGISGGGPHALACAALLPDLVAAAAALASPAPYDAEGLDYFEGMGQANVDDTKLLLTDEAAARAKADQDREEALAVTPEDAFKGLESLLTPTDAAVMTGELAEFIVSSIQQGLIPGSEGWWEDSCCLVWPWGFELSDITVPVLMIQGREDKFVPFGHGEWLAGQIPGVEARLLDHDGHLTLMRNRVPEVHAWLADRL